MEHVTISGRISGIYTNRLGYKTLDVGFYTLLEPLDFVVDSLAGIGQSIEPFVGPSSYVSHRRKQ